MFIYLEYESSHYKRKQIPLSNVYLNGKTLISYFSIIYCCTRYFSNREMSITSPKFELESLFLNITSMVPLSRDTYMCMNI